MSLGRFERHIGDRLSVISNCFEDGLFLPGLVLLYTGVESMAWLARPEGKKDSSSSDFIEWVDRYMLDIQAFEAWRDSLFIAIEKVEFEPPLRLTCTAKQLYAARCALIHSYTPDNVGTYWAEDKLVYFGHGVPAEERPESLEGADGKRYRPTNVFDLLEVFRRGVNLFREDIRRDRQLAERILKRTPRLFSQES